MSETSERHEIEFEQGVCLPLKSFYINNLNGFPPGEQPHEQTYAFLWAMVMVEHAILAVLYIIESIVPDTSAEIVAEQKGQAQYIKKRQNERSDKVRIDPEAMRGRFVHPELMAALTDVRQTLSVCLPVCLSVPLLSLRPSSSLSPRPRSPSSLSCCVQHTHTYSLPRTHTHAHA